MVSFSSFCFSIVSKFQFFSELKPNSKTKGTHNDIWRAPEQPERLLIPISMSVISPSTSTVPPSAVPIAVSVPELDVDNNIECDQMVLDDNAQSQHAQPIVAMDSEDNIELMEALDNYERNLTT